MFLDNQTAIEQHNIRAFLVPLVDAFNGVSGLNSPERLIEFNVTDSNGFFDIQGLPLEIIEPGFGAIMLEVEQKGYVSGRTILTPNSSSTGAANSWWMNITDDATLNHTSPRAINAPIVGAGATTIIEGFIAYEQEPFSDASLVVNSTVWLSFTSTGDGAQNVSTQVGPTGAWSIELTLDELETKTNVSATLVTMGGRKLRMESRVQPIICVQPKQRSRWIFVMRQISRQHLKVQGLTQVFSFSTTTFLLMVLP